MERTDDLLAVLIDADNVSASSVGDVLAEIASYGTASVKRVYGDWTTSNLRSWKTAASVHVIQPIQQFANTKGKNSTDSALIIDAMDLLYTQRFDGFCIVSSDSDFTRLASRIREQGVTVYGFGERKTPESFRNACDRFTYLDVVAGSGDETEATPEVAEEPQPQPEPVVERPARPRPPERVPGPKLRQDSGLLGGLRSAVTSASGEDGWAELAAVGNMMRNQRPDFDSRNWGYAKLSDLVRAIEEFDVTARGAKGGVRLRHQK